MKRVLIITALLVLNVVVPIQACDTDYECQMRCYWACGELYEPESEELRQCQLYCEDIFGERHDDQLIQDYLDYRDAQDEFLMN